MRATARRCGAVTVAFVVLAGCARGSELPRVVVSAPPSAGAATTAFCRALEEELPDELGSLARRDADGSRVAAWGDPPLRLRCGVPPVLRAPGDTQRILIGGVAWHAHERAEDVLWTTLELRVPVEVSIPLGVDGQALAALAPALQAAAG